MKIWLLPASKNWTVVAPATSASVKMTPKALVVAGVVVPGTKKFTSVILLLTAVNNRGSLKVWKSFGNPNRMGLPEAALELTRKPEPGVLNTAPRGDVELKKSPGKALGSE